MRIYLKVIRKNDGVGFGVEHTVNPEDFDLSKLFEGIIEWGKTKEKNPANLESKELINYKIEIGAYEDLHKR